MPFASGSDSSVQHNFPVRWHGVIDCCGGSHGFYGAGANSPDVASVRIADEEVKFTEFWSALVVIAPWPV